MNRRVNKKFATETNQLPGFHRIYSVNALFFILKKRDKLICLWKQNDILHLCYKFTKSFPSYDSPERQFHCFVFIFYLVDGTCKIFVERDCDCPVYDPKPEFLQGGGKCVSFHYHPPLIFFSTPNLSTCKTVVHSLKTTLNSYTK